MMAPPRRYGQRRGRGRTMPTAIAASVTALPMSIRGTSTLERSRSGIEMFGRSSFERSGARISDRPRAIPSRLISGSRSSGMRISLVKVAMGSSPRRGARACAARRSRWSRGDGRDLATALQVVPPGAFGHRPSVARPATIGLARSGGTVGPRTAGDRSPIEGMCERHPTTRVVLPAPGGVALEVAARSSRADPARVRRVHRRVDLARPDRPGRARARRQGRVHGDPGRDHPRGHQRAGAARHPVPARKPVGHRGHRRDIRLPGPRLLPRGLDPPLVRGRWHRRRAPRFVRLRGLQHAAFRDPLGGPGRLLLRGAGCPAGAPTG